MVHVKNLVENGACKKSNGKWCMFAYYNDLNKVCPKYAYPFINIDKLKQLISISIIVIHERILYYNQIKMHLDNEEKTTLMMESANHCYKKNHRGPYRQYDCQEYKGRGVCPHLVEVFMQLKKYNTLLNP
ncbi:hypothetical protein CR513_39716, partial [Mucuna pruriens]